VVFFSQQEGHQDAACGADLQSLRKGVDNEPSSSVDQNKTGLILSAPA